MGPESHFSVVVAVDGGENDTECGDAKLTGGRKELSGDGQNVV